MKDWCDQTGAESAAVLAALTASTVMETDHQTKELLSLWQSFDVAARADLLAIARGLRASHRELSRIQLEEGARGCVSREGEVT